MGLDQYAHVIPAPVLGDAQVDFQHYLSGAEDGSSKFFSPALGREVEPQQLHYWRKHPNLHGWMQKLYREKGGTDSDFNCSPVRLTPEDIDRLEADIKARKLPQTGGFFFGASDGSEIEDDLEFVRKARQAFAEELAVWYDSWW